MSTIDNPIYDRLRELSWRRELTPAEEAELRSWLAAHPEARAEWEAESRLNAALGRLPDAPMASNFTARVMQVVEREAAAESDRRVWPWQMWLRLGWLRKAVAVAAVAVAGLISYLMLQEAERKGLAESVAIVADVSSLPSPEVLQDFDAIRVSNPAPTPDEHLLAVLK